MMDYFGRLSLKWEDLLSYKHLPKCSRGASEKIAQDYEEEKVHMFLMGLDDARFGNVCTNIICMEQLPDLNSVYHRVIKEERRILSSRVETRQDAVGFVAKAEPTQMENHAMKDVVPARGRNNSMACSHCGRTRHEKNDCWQIIGFPEWWTERTRESVQDAGEEEDKAGVRPDPMQCRVPHLRTRELLS